MSALGLPCKYLLLYKRLSNLPAAQATSAESSTRKCMIGANWTIGHTEPLAVFIYQRSYLIASYKNVNHVDFSNYYQIYYAFLFRLFYFIMIFIYECFVVH